MNKTIGNCPGCGQQLKRVLHQLNKGRYQCANSACEHHFRTIFNRYGELRGGQA